MKFSSFFRLKRHFSNGRNVQNVLLRQTLTPSDAPTPPPPPPEMSCCLCCIRQIEIKVPTFVFLLSAICVLHTLLRLLSKLSFLIFFFLALDMKLQARLYQSGRLRICFPGWLTLFHTSSNINEAAQPNRTVLTDSSDLSWLGSELLRCPHSCNPRSEPPR